MDVVVVDGGRQEGSRGNGMAMARVFGSHPFIHSFEERTMQKRGGWQMGWDKQQQHKRR